MKPGERICFITESAQMLGAKSWQDIDLVLDQFGFRTWDDATSSWTQLEYCTASIKQGSDEQIVPLHEYLKGEDAAPAGTTAVDGPWNGLPVRVFFSHVHSNRHFVGQVKRRLAERYGLDAFVAHDDIDPSKHWREVIKTALATCDMCVVFLDPGFHESQWCDQEVGWALARGIPVIPIRPQAFDRSTARDGFLEEKQDLCLDRLCPGTNAAYWLANEIFQSIFRHTALATVATRALVEAFVTSNTYDSTRRLWSMIVDRQTIEAEQLRRLEYAVSTNSQVYDASAPPNATPVPELVRALIEKFEPPEAADSGTGSGSYSDKPPF